ncbi:MAG: hypothetical protein ACYC1Q_11530 [Bacteroidia bacterium]
MTRLEIKHSPQLLVFLFVLFGCTSIIGKEMRMKSKSTDKCYFFFGSNDSMLHYTELDSTLKIGEISDLWGSPDSIIYEYKTLWMYDNPSLGDSLQLVFVNLNQVGETPKHVTIVLPGKDNNGIKLLHFSQLAVYDTVCLSTSELTDEYFNVSCGVTDDYNIPICKAISWKGKTLVFPLRTNGYSGDPVVFLNKSYIRKNTKNCYPASLDH